MKPKNEMQFLFWCVLLFVVGLFAVASVWRWGYQPPAESYADSIDITDCDDPAVECSESMAIVEWPVRELPEGAIPCPEPSAYSYIEPLLATCFKSIMFTLKSGERKGDLEGAWETEPEDAEFAEGQFQLCVCENGMLFMRKKE
jgi:hypothetical protein